MGEDMVDRSRIHRAQERFLDVMMILFAQTKKKTITIAYVEKTINLQRRSISLDPLFNHILVLGEVISVACQRVTRSQRFEKTTYCSQKVSIISIKPVGTIRSPYVAQGRFKSTDDS
jgi:hypothetical protein